MNYEQNVAPHATPPSLPLILLDPGIIFASTLPAAAPGPGIEPPVIVDPGPELLPAFIREPTATETAIEAPWRLIISPSRFAGWAHATQPVTHSGLTELWHTRLGVRGERPDAPGSFRVDETSDFYRTIRAIWTPGFDAAAAPAFGDSFQHAVDPNERWQLVRLMSDFFISNFTPQPAQVEHLILSPLGAWMDVRGEWNSVAAGPDFDLREWRHITSQGRDQYVRIVKDGFLFPTGHPAVRVDIYERKFQSFSFSPRIGGGDSVAYLRKKTFIVVREPERTYPASGQPDGGAQWPFTRVRITTTITPDLENPTFLNPTRDDVNGLGLNAFFPHVAGQPFPFHLVATDLDGQEIEFAAQLAFLSTTVDAAPIVAAYMAANDDLMGARRDTPLQGQSVAIAPSDDPGDTSVQIQILTLGAAGPDGFVADGDAPFFPLWTSAEVRLPGVEQAKGGPLGPTMISPHPDFIASGFGAGNPAGVFAQVEALELSFEGGESSDKSGGIITPNMVISGLSRALGVVGGPTSPIPTEFDPDAFFQEAKLLGGLLLSDILDTATDLVNEAPGITTRVIYPKGDNSQLPRANETRFYWTVTKPTLKPDPLGIFQPKDGCSLTLRAVFLTPLDPPGEPTYEVVGDLRKFDVQLLGSGAAKFIILQFNKLIFRSETGAKPTVDPDIRKVVFAGPLEFVNPLQEFLKSSNPGPFVDVTPTGITAGYTLAVPTVGVGVLTVQNIGLGASLHIPFTGDPARVRFNFSERGDPFLVTVWGIGGGGFFAISIGTDGVEILEAEFNIAAALALNFVVAAGEVHVIIGIYFKMEVIDGNEMAELTAFLRFGGSLNVLGLISVSIELYLGLRYEISPQNGLWGQAKLTIEVDLIFFSPSIEIEVERQLAGPSQNAQSSVLGPGELETAQLGAGLGHFSELIARDAWLQHAAAFLGAPAGPAPEPPGTTPPPAAGGDTIAVRLESGWNLVGWNGDPTAVDAALDSIAGAFSDAFVYEAPSDVFLRYSPSAPSFISTLTTLPAAAGVWILATRAVVWDQPVLAAVASVDLLPGFNLVAWRGVTTSAAEAFAAISEQLLTAFTYETTAERFRSFAFNRPPVLNDLDSLRPGDGVWLNMVEAAVWRPADAGSA